MAVRPASVVSVFSGIGALDLAIGRVFPDARTALYVENEATSVLRLAANMEAGRIHAAPVWSDVRTLPGRELRGRVDMVVGGFPCQDISNAGKGAGLGGERSGLFFDLMAAVRDIRPRYLFLENVAAITVRGLDAVLGTLAEVGLDARWGCLRASDVGAPHGRDRWWCLAWDRQMVNAPRVGGAEQPIINDTRRALDSPEPGADGRVVVGHPAARVPLNGRTDPAGAAHLRGGAELADDHGRGRGLGADGAILETDGRRGAREPARGGSPVADAIGGRHNGRAPDPWGRPLGRTAAAGHGAAGDATVGDAERNGSPSGLPATTGRHGLAPEPAVALHAGDRLPQWPPGPADSGAWQAVLARWPHLAPATVGAVRRVVDGDAPGDDLCLCHRGDRLRGLGNAVVPQCAEAALRLLWWDAFGEWV